MNSMLPMFNHVQPEQFRDFCPPWVIIGDPCVKQLLSVKSTEKGQNEKQRSRKHTHKTKDGFTRTPPKTGMNSGDLEG